MTQTPARTVRYDGFTVTARLVDGVPVVLSYTVDATYTREDFAACHGPEFLTMTPAEFVTSTPHRTQTLSDALGGVLTPETEHQTVIREMIDELAETVAELRSNLDRALQTPKGFEGEISDIREQLIEPEARLAALEAVLDAPTRPTPLTPSIVLDMLDAVDESEFQCSSDEACTRRDCASEVLAAMADQIATLPIPESAAPVLAQFLATPNPNF